LGKKGTYRQVQTSYWQDPFVMDLTPEEKFFYVYLLTNTRTTQCGIFELPQQLIAAETGYNRETVDKLLKRFIDYGKISYSTATKELLIINWMKYNFINSATVISCIHNNLLEVKDQELLKELYDICTRQGLLVDSIFEGILYPKDTVSIPIGEEERIENKEIRIENIEEEYIDNSIKNEIVDNANNMDNFEENIDKPTPSDETSDKREQIPYSEIVNLYNSICISLPRATKMSKSRNRALKSFWNEFKSFKVIKDIFTRAENSEFLSGRSGNWSGCSFDWIIKASNAIKIFDGNYDNKPHPNPPNVKAQVDTFNNYKQRDYDFNELEKKLLGRCDG
jgi:hypothetical protein